jgi:hypothetical protein
MPIFINLKGDQWTSGEDHHICTRSTSNIDIYRMLLSLPCRFLVFLLYT